MSSKSFRFVVGVNTSSNPITCQRKTKQHYHKREKNGIAQINQRDPIVLFNYPCVLPLIRSIYQAGINLQHMKHLVAYQKGCAIHKSMADSCRHISFHHCDQGSIPSWESSDNLLFYDKTKEEIFRLWHRRCISTMSNLIHVQITYDDQCLAMT